MPFTLINAHGMMMVLAWIFAGSIGVIFARYGRAVRLGNRRQFLGKAVWFQIHRFFLSISALFTLLGFFFILVFEGGKWLNVQISLFRFIHSICGGTIVCCTMLQIYLALYRCNPRSRFRYIFDWSHRIIGFLAFILSIPTMFIMIVQWPKNRTSLLSIISIWTGWIVIVILIFERIEYQQRRAVTPIRTIGNRENISQSNCNTNSPQDIESGNLTNVGSRYLNFVKLIILLLHIMISIILSISFIVIFCQ